MNNKKQLQEQLAPNLPSAQGGIVLSITLALLSIFDGFQWGIVIALGVFIYCITYISNAQKRIQDAEKEINRNKR